MSGSRAAIPTVSPGIVAGIEATVDKDGAVQKVKMLRSD